MIKKTRQKALLALIQQQQVGRQEDIVAHLKH